MLNTVLIDAGPLIALFDKDDKYHKKIKKFVSNGRFKFVSTTAVFTEVTHMLDFNINVQIDFLEWVMNRGIVLCEILQSDIAGIIVLTRKYADRPMDFADATLVVAAEKTGIRKIISIDSDFDIYRLPGNVKIKNVFSI
ncbi:MAG: PIN domain-containing protein [Treponema sp.]|jgi:predicted nucleic acid-binding protein|nr:PIN domain-containing protein [Treponema sp.]